MKEKKVTRKNSKTFVTKVVFILLGAVLSAYALCLIAMLLWGLMTSLKSPSDFTGDLGFIGKGGNYLGFPRLGKHIIGNSREHFFKLSNYKVIIDNLSWPEDVSYYLNDGTKISYTEQITFWSMFKNTLLYTCGGAIIYAFMPAMTAYLCAKYDYKLSRAIFIAYTIMMCMPIVGSLPTELSFLREMGLYDSIFGNYVQKMTGSGMYFFVYYAYFKGASNTYREAAIIDGAGPLTVMFRIYFPLAIKIVSTVFLIQFVALWNDYQTPLVYLPTRPTLAYGIFYVSTPNANFNAKLYEVPVQIAGPMMLAIPILIIFIAFKNRLMGDITLGGIKE